MNRYTEEGDVIGLDLPGSEDRGEIVAEITTSFMVLLAIYFPSVTGRKESCVLIQVMSFVEFRRASGNPTILY